ncbi:MAG: peptidylprolyl isomerase [Acidobacteriota bacterium]
MQEVVILGSSGLKADELTLLADEIRQQIINGGTLEAVAAPYAEQGLSTSPVDLGWVTPGDLDRDLEEAVWNLPEGAITAAIPGRGGLHIIQVSQRQEAELKSFVEVKDQIQARERARKLRDEMAEYTAELEASAYIVANPPPEAAGFRASLKSGPTKDESLGVALTAPLMTEPEIPDVESAEETGPVIPVGSPSGSKAEQPEAPTPEVSPPGPSIPTGAPDSIPTGGPSKGGDSQGADPDDDGSDGS